MFIWPIQAWLMSLGNNSPLLWGFETLTGGWYRLRNYFSRFDNHNTIMTLDWSGFDRDARHSVIKDIHSDILRPMFDFSSGYHPTHDYPTSDSESYSPHRLENLWNWMTNAILKTPLLMHDGSMLEFQHSGIYSGYLQTQLLDSIYNLIMIYTIMFRLGFKEHQLEIKVQGDDSVIAILCNHTLVKDWLIPQFTYYATKYFGSKVSEQKTELHEGWDNCEVLKYRNRNGLPYRDPLALIAQLVHPERKKSLSALKARAIGIAYANSGSDLRVYRTCESIYEYLDTFIEGADLRALPEQLKFIQKYLRTGYFDVTRFPSFNETISRLMDQRLPLPSKKYWPLSHFIGLPGQVNTT